MDQTTNLDRHEFVFLDYELNAARTQVGLNYKINRLNEEFSYQERFVFSGSLPQSSVTDSLLRALHLAVGIGYYKSTVAPKIVHPYFMDSAEASFWNKIYGPKGLGEFLYINGLDPDCVAQFSRQEGIKHVISDDIAWSKEATIAISGGKDSIVARQILEDIGIPAKGFLVSTGDNTGQAEPVANALKTDLKITERYIDRSLIEFNKRPDALNGHTPLSSMLAIAGCLQATINSHKYVVIANEASASESQAEHFGQKVNHQWSKSFEFEQAFQNYIKQYVSSELIYFSAIRQLSSLTVMKIFSQLPALFPIFTSDNSVFKIDPMQRPQGTLWSQESSKTLSSFILLAPFVDEKTLVSAFKFNPLDNISLSELLSNLIGRGSKPVLDCVGTPTEILVALNMLKVQNKYQDTQLMQYARQHNWVYDGDWQAPFSQFLQPHSEHALPDELAASIMSAIEVRLS